MMQHATGLDVRENLRRLNHAGAVAVTRIVVRLQSGTVLVEYAILAALIAIVTMAAVQALGTGIAGVFTRILSSIQGIG